MPSGKVHNAINTLSLLALSGGYSYTYSNHLFKLEPGAVLAFVSSFVVGTFLLSPDLDLAEQHVSIKNNWGWLGFLWVPYGWIFSHRGTSHSWILGPFTRLIYLALLLALPIYFLRDPILHLKLQGVTRGPIFDLLTSFKNFWRKPEVARDTLLALAAGYYISQWLHLIADGVAPDVTSSFMSRKRRR